MLVLDTNVVSELMRQQPEPRVLDWIAGQPLETMAITAVTVMEVRYGLHCLPGGRRRSALETRFRQFLDRGFAGRILAFDTHTATSSAEIRAACRRLGRAISPEDTMIAGIAKYHGATVVTRDRGGFSGYGVPVVDPWEQGD
jgi:predicted nucleic acid-binding protein